MSPDADAKADIINAGIDLQETTLARTRTPEKKLAPAAATAAKENPTVKPRWHILGWEFEFCSLVDEIARLQKVVAGQQMKRYRITQVQWVALVYLSRSDGMRQVDLQVELGITRGGCTHLVNRLQKAGWIDCRPDGQDGRVNRLFITASAKRVLGKIQIVSEHIHRVIFQNTSEAEGIVAMETMYQVRDRLLGLNGGGILE